MAAPDTVRDFGNAFDIDVVRHEDLVAGGSATLAGDRVDTGRIEGCLVLPDYRLFIASGDIGGQLTIYRISSSDVAGAFFLLNFTRKLGKP